MASYRLYLGIHPFLSYKICGFRQHQTQHFFCLLFILFSSITSIIRCCSTFSKTIKYLSQLYFFLFVYLFTTKQIEFKELSFFLFIFFSLFFFSFFFSIENLKHKNKFSRVLFYKFCCCCLLSSLLLKEQKKKNKKKITLKYFTFFIIFYFILYYIYL